MNEAELVAAVLGGFLSGLAVWVLSAVALAMVATVRARRVRRRQIISLVNRAHAVAFSAIDARLFDEAWAFDSDAPLRDAKARYDDLTAQALNLFEPAESEVAFWCAAELYAGWRSPFHELRKQGSPRQPHGKPPSVVSNYDMHRTWMLPRAAELAGWADVKVPWDFGNARGPQYATLGTPGDTSRHSIVIPNSDVNADLLRPYANLIAPPRFDPKGRRAAYLRSRYLDA